MEADSRLIAYDASGLDLTTGHSLHVAGFENHILTFIVSRNCDDTTGFSPSKVWLRFGENMPAGRHTR
jgi:hypothetical protein